MRPILVIVLAVLALTMPKLTLIGSVAGDAVEAGSTADYLKAIGIDLQSAGVASVARDVVPLQDGGTASLDELAKQKKSKTEILRFVSTRLFVRAYREDPTTRLPATVDYEATYLTPEEKKLVQPAFRRAGDELYLRSLQQQKKK